MHHIFFICSSVSGRLVCLHALAIVNSAAVNIEVHVSFQIKSFHLLDVCPGVELPDHMTTLIFSFLRMLHTVLHSDCTNLYSSNSVGGFPFLHTLSSTYNFIDILMMAILTSMR